MRNKLYINLSKKFLLIQRDKKYDVLGKKWSKFRNLIDYKDKIRDII
jgi:hypothetical protein